MSFVKKEWKDRIAEYINRRRLTHEDGRTELVEVARDEGTVSQEGDAFNAETMNALEERVAAGFEEVEGKVSIHNFTSGETILSFAVANKANRVMGFITNAAVPSDSPTTEECFVIVERDTGGDRIMVRLKPYNGYHQWEYQRSIWDSAWREDNWILKEYLQLTGGTVSGDVYVDKSAIGGDAFVEVKSTGKKIWLIAEPDGGSIGLWDATNRRWIIRLDNNNIMQFDSRASWISTDGKYAIAPGPNAYNDAPISVNANTSEDNSLRAGYGFHNGGHNGVFLFLDTDGRLKTARNGDGAISTLICSNMITVSGNEIILEWL